MAATIALCATMAALGFALASLRHDLQRWSAERRHICRQLDRIKRGEVRWTITERKI